MYIYIYIGIYIYTIYTIYILYIHIYIYIDLSLPGDGRFGVSWRSQSKRTLGHVWVRVPFSGVPTACLGERPSKHV